MLCSAMLTLLGTCSLEFLPEVESLASSMNLINQIRKLTLSLWSKFFELIMKGKFLKSGKEQGKSFPYPRSRTSSVWTMRRYTIRDTSFRIFHFLLGFCLGILLYCELYYVGLIEHGRVQKMSIFEFLQGDERYNNYF